MDRKQLLQTALRVLQRYNRRLPIESADAEVLKRNAPSTHADLSVDQIAIEIIQRLVKK